MIRAVAAFALVLAAASPGRACPLCESEAGRRVRAGIFDADFGYHLAATLLPFLAFVAIIGLIHLGPPRSKRPTRAAADPRRDGGDRPTGPAAKDQRWTTGRTAGR